MSYLVKALNILVLLVIQQQLQGQTPGEIFEPSTGPSAFLDPDSDGFITSSGAAFTAGSEQSQFESNWVSRFQIVSEPSGDASTGSACASVDIVDEPGEKYALYTSVYDPDGFPTNSDGDEYLIIRLRIGKDPGSANFGYSILMDTDSKYGSGVDANAVSGNQGFEIEIRLKNGGGGKGVHLDDVDGTISGTTRQSYSLTTHHQKSYAAYTASGCTNDPVFVDMAVPFSDLTTYFGVVPSTSLRLVAATTSSGASALNSNVSDISGTDDDDPSYIAVEDVLNDITTSQPTNQQLPVDLYSMEVIEQGNEHYLFWETASEINTDFFAIEISQNGTDFTPFTTTTAKGSGVLGATYRELLPALSDLGFYFVRLKMVDFDEYTEYSKVLMVKEEKNSYTMEVNLFPVPARDFLFIEASVSEELRYVISDPSGRFIAQGTHMSGKAVDVSTLMKGLYIMHFPDAKGFAPVRFVID